MVIRSKSEALRRVSARALNEQVPERRFKSLGEVAHHVNVSSLTIWRAANDGRLKTIYIGARRLVSPEEVERIEREGLPLPGKIGKKASGLSGR